MALEESIKQGRKHGQKHFDLSPLLKARDKYGCKYLIAYNGRSDGKTYAVLYHMIRNYIERGEKGYIIRRWREDIVASESQKIFNGLTCNDNGDNAIAEISGGKWDRVYYYRSEFYLANDTERDNDSFCHVTALTQTEHDKGGTVNNVTTILFDEFLAINGYIPNEWKLFQNTISTIVRNRSDATIYMLGNTVTKYCPYFAEMGLTHVKQQKQGTIDIYRFGDSKLAVAVYYAEKSAKEKPSDVYFAFDNPNLMITSGEWELDIYPHRPTEIKPKDIKYIYFIKFGGELLQCEIISDRGGTYTYIHRKSTDLKDPEHDMIFDAEEYHSGYNYGRNILRPANNIQKRIAWYYGANKIFYQDNEIGDIVHNYLNWCRTAATIG